MVGIRVLFVRAKKEWMSNSEKIQKIPAYGQDNFELRAELDAIKKATGAKRIELSRKLFGRFCEFQEDLSKLGNFCNELGLSRELSGFVFSGLRSWAEGGSVESALFVESKLGRPPKTERNQILFEDVRLRVQQGWDVHAACYATADALVRGEVIGLTVQELSPSSIRRIYYSVLNETDSPKQVMCELPESEVPTQEGSEAIDTEMLQGAKDGKWQQHLLLFQHMHKVGDLVLANRYMKVVGRVAGLNMDGLEYWQKCLQKVIDGHAPNEAFHFDASEE